MTSELARLLRNSIIHIEFHSKNGLNNEMIKLSVKYVFVKP
jgi:hypothetical protein